MARVLIVIFKSSEDPEADIESPGFRVMVPKDPPIKGRTSLLDIGYSRRMGFISPSNLKLILTSSVSGEVFRIWQDKMIAVYLSGAV